LWEHVVELKHLETVQSRGSEPGVDGRGSTLEVACRDAEAVNCALMAGEDGVRQAQIINDRVGTATSFGVSYADDLLGGEYGDCVDMNCL
jgi:hypothetical protein